MKAKITKKLVDEVKPQNLATIVWDSEISGFGLKVTPAGRRVYFLYYRTRSGQQRRPTIGIHGSLAPEEARKIARTWLAQVAAGIDISEERRTNRAAITVAQLADRYLSEYAHLHKKPRSVATDRANIENHIIPLIGRIRVDQLRRPDIERVLLGVREGKTARRLPAQPRGRRIVRGGQGIANRTIALLSKMLACAIGWELIAVNVAQGIRKFKEYRKDRFLEAAEVGRLLAALEAANNDQSESLYAIAAIRLLLLTGMRSSEVLGLRWGQVDGGRACLRLDDTKTGRRVIPLGSQAMAVIQSVPVGAEEQLVFQSAVSGRLLALTRPWHRIRAAAVIDSGVTIHTLRHTFASWSVMGGHTLAQVGAVLGHKSAQTTLRYADHHMEALRQYSQGTADGMFRGAGVAGEAVDPLRQTSTVELRTLT